MEIRVSRGSMVRAALLLLTLFMPNVTDAAINLSAGVAGHQERVKLVTDGQDGEFAIWFDAGNIRGARLSAGGSLLWAAGGELLASQSSDYPSVASDQTGGFYVAWANQSNIYVQRFTSAGDPVWPAARTINNGNYSDPIIATSTAGDLVIAYTKSTGVFVEGLNQTDGSQLWVTNIDSHTYFYVNGLEYSEGSIYVCYNADEFEKRCQKLNSSGTAQWGSGVVIASSGDSAIEPMVTDDTGGVYFIWATGVPFGTWSVKAQHVSANGTLLWGTGHVLGTVNGSNFSSFPAAMEISRDGQGAAMFAWYYPPGVNPSNWTVKVTKAYGATYTEPWSSTFNTSRGGTSPWYGTFGLLGPDPSGGATIMYSILNQDLTTDVQARHVSNSGVFASPVTLSSETGNSYQFFSSSRANENLVVAWQADHGSGAGKEIWARLTSWQELNPSAFPSTLPIISDVSAYCDSIVGVGQYFDYQYKFKTSWNTSATATTQVEYRPFGTTQWQATVESASSGLQHYVNVPNVLAGTTYELRPVSRSGSLTTRGEVTAVTTEPAPILVSNFTLQQGIDLENLPAHLVLTIGYTTSQNSSCSIRIRKHLTPAVPFSPSDAFERNTHGLTHEHNLAYIEPAHTTLQWNTDYDMVITVWPNNIPFGIDATDPANEPIVGEDSQFPDGFGGYTATLVYIKFKTIKKDGTGGSEPEFTMETIDGRLLGIGAMTQLLPNAPNPFSSETNIQFSVKEMGPVHLTIYDIQGRLVKTLVDEVVNEGFHRVTWDRRASSGQVVNPGIYFYRMVVGDFVDTKKMVVFR